MVKNWVLPKLSEVFNRCEVGEVRDLPSPSESSFPLNPQEQPSLEEIARAKLKAQREWRGAIAALEALLLPLTESRPSNPAILQGLILSGPAPILSQAILVSRFHIGIFTREAVQNLALMPSQLSEPSQIPPEDLLGTVEKLPLLPADPLAAEQFCLAFTPWFSLLLVLGEDSRGLPAFHFSFEPEAVTPAWLALRSRLSANDHPQLRQLDSLAAQFPPVVPDYRLVAEFSRQLLQHLPSLTVSEPRQPRAVSEGGLRNRKGRKSPHAAVQPPATPSLEAELLQALTHEIRTPLTAIRTMARLLLRNKSLSPLMVKQLEAIDRECTEQIERMELIFRAVELETTACQERQVQLVPMSLEQVFEQSIPRWKKQAQRHNVLLDVVLPQKLPQVVSDPALLDRVLTGLMEKFIRSLSAGGQIRVEVTTAGNQLKLQFHTQSAYPANPFQALGQLLMFQPATGSLSLNLEVTKNLLNALGGKLIVRQRSPKGEVLTIFFPLRF